MVRGSREEFGTIIILSLSAQVLKLMGLSPSRDSSHSLRDAPSAASTAGQTQSLPEESTTPEGVFPPPASRTGKRYYVFDIHHGGPLVVCGKDEVLRILGGSFVSRGKAPKGFATLEEAVAEHRRAWPRVRQAQVVW